MSDFEGLEVTAVSDDVVVENDTPGKGVCPDCGKLLTITSEGVLRKHKCVNDISTAGKGGSHHAGARAKRARTPSSVRNLGVAVIAGGVEYAAAASVSRWVECPPSEVPSDLPDADVMIGPILDAIWPRMPKEAQRVIKVVADESDLLVAAMAWWEYGTGLRKWADSKWVLVENEATPTRGYADEPVSFPTNGDGVLGPLEPFTPNAVGDAPM
jgi:hypothetical protein